MLAVRYEMISLVEVPDLMLRMHVVMVGLRSEVVKVNGDLGVVRGIVLRVVPAEVNFSSATRSKQR